MKKIIIRAIFILSICGCTTANIARTYGVDTKEIKSSSGFTGNTIAIDMSYLEVLDRWGQPKHIYKNPKNDYGADESWIYSNMKQIFGEGIGFELLFKNKKLIKLFKMSSEISTYGNRFT